jgi:hypothetical protein
MLVDQSRRGSLALVLLAGLLGAVPAAAATLQFSVDSRLHEHDAVPGDGSCSSTPSGRCTLRAAIEEANGLPGSNSVTVDLQSRARYTEGWAMSPLGLPAALEISNPGLDLTINGAGATIGTRNVRFASGVPFSGGAIEVHSGAAVTINDLVITASNIALNVHDSGAVTLNRSAIKGCGIALEVADSGAVTINDSLVKRSGAAALDCFRAMLRLARTSLLLNRRKCSNPLCAGGAAIHAFTCTVDVDSSTIARNVTRDNEGVVSLDRDSIATLTNVTLSKNVGGGIRLEGVAGQATLNNVTVTGTSRGASVDAALGSVTVQNSLIAGNRSPTCAVGTYGMLLSAGYNLSDDPGCAGFLTAVGDQNGTNPRLGPLADNGGPTQTHALIAGSPAIETGNPALPGSGGAACAATDQRGVTRPQGARCDIGAFEAAP